MIDKNEVYKELMDLLNKHLDVLDEDFAFFGELAVEANLKVTYGVCVQDDDGDYSKSIRDTELAVTYEGRLSSEDGDDPLFDILKGLAKLSKAIEQPPIKINTVLEAGADYEKLKEDFEKGIMVKKLKR